MGLEDKIRSVIEEKVNEIGINIVSIKYEKENGVNYLRIFIDKEPFINTYTIYYIKSYLPILIVAIIASTPICKNIIEKLKKNNLINNIINILEPFYIIILLLLVTAYLIDSSYNPFLYFRF